MNYRESFNMSDYSYSSFLKEIRKEPNQKKLNNSAELLLQAELITISPIEGVDEGFPTSSLEFKNNLIDNYNYLVDNTWDCNVYQIGYLTLDVLVDFLTLDFNKKHRN